MATSRKRGENIRPRRPPATTPEARENQLVSLAIDLAEKQLREGTASAQVVTHYLKIATAREKLERQKLERENELLRAKSQSYASAQRIEELYDEAIKAMKTYGGHDDETLYEDYYED